MKSAVQEDPNRSERVPECTKVTEPGTRSHAELQDKAEGIWRDTKDSATASDKDESLGSEDPVSWRNPVARVLKGKSSP